MTITVIGSGGGTECLPLTGGMLTGNVAVNVPTNKYTESHVAVIYGDNNDATLSASSGGSQLQMYGEDYGHISASATNNSSIEMMGQTRSIITLRNSSNSGRIDIRVQGSARYISGLTPPTSDGHAANKSYVDRTTRLWAVSNGTTTGTWAGVPSVLGIDSANRWKMNLHYNATSSYETPTLLGLKISAGFTAKDNSNYTMTITQSGGGFPDATVLTVKSAYQNSVFAVTMVDLAMISTDSDITFTASFNDISGILQPYMIIEALEFYM